MIVSSDFSFAERAVIEVWIWLWFIHRVWSTDQFASLQLYKIRNFDLKSIITLLVIIMLPIQAVFDMIWTYIKYNEGFILDPLTNQIFTKPAFYMNGKEKVALWTNKDILLKTITEYVLACSFAFQVGTLALMQAFWNHLTSQMEGKPFIRSWKFRFYVVWFLASIIIFPAARGLTGNDIVLVETVPELIFSVQLFVIFLLGIQNGKKLNNLLSTIQHQRTTTGQATILRLHYFIEMNGLLMIGALLVCIGFLPTTLDTIVGSNYLNGSKFFMDLFVIHANFGTLMLWAAMILIIYPRYYITGLSGILTQKSENAINRVSIQSLESNSNKLKNQTSNSFVINLTATTTTMTTQPMESQPIETTITNNKSSSITTNANNDKVLKSISSLLEQQQQQIEIYRHKTSMSISSITTTPTSPLFPSPPPNSILTI